MSVKIKNSELLAEIAKSKNSYCSYKRASDVKYDKIVILQAGQTLKQAVAENREDGVTYRIMSAEHVPAGAKRRAGNAGKVAGEKVWVPFPAFVHVRNGVEVGRSHWIGSISNGEFCITHGRVTERLGALLLLLAQNYASKHNFRGYSYRDEMISNAVVTLVRQCLKFNEGISDNPFSFLTMIAHRAFLTVLNSEKNTHNIRDGLLVEAGLNGSSAYMGDPELDARFEEELATAAHGAGIKNEEE